jgi:hypothetical protein
MAVKTNVPPKRYIILKFPSKSTSVQGSAFHILDIRQSGRFGKKSVVRSHPQKYTKSIVPTIMKYVFVTFLYFHPCFL